MDHITLIILPQGAQGLFLFVRFAVCLRDWGSCCSVLVGWVQDAAHTTRFIGKRICILVCGDVL